MITWGATTAAVLHPHAQTTFEFESFNHTQLRYANLKQSYLYIDPVVPQIKVYYLYRTEHNSKYYIIE